MNILQQKKLTKSKTTFNGQFLELLKFSKLCQNDTSGLITIKYCRKNYLCNESQRDMCKFRIFPVIKFVK